MTHPTNEQLNEYVERALSPADDVDVVRHVEACSQCALVVADLQQITREAASLGPVTPPTHVWKQIESQLGGMREEGRGKRGEGRGERWTTQWGPAWALATAALVILAFLTGRFVEHRIAPEQIASTDSVDRVDATASENVRERILLIAVGDHLERSQMVLVELANAHTRDALDISAERQSADELLASNRLYRQTAAQMGQTNVADLLDDLERVLVEVARGPSQVSMGQLAEIQQRIESQGILFKVKVIRNNTDYR
jgi:hypothetical protein